jgi:acyl-[acyl-carrier-protein]-phospholipid O-acyltransferase/long-chain-fatty-acid--[acyl-carrier-protein] ligase
MLNQEDGYALVVIGVADASKGEQLVLLTTSEELTAERVREKLTSAGLPNLWVPKLVVRVGQIPVLGSGKLDLKGCKDLAHQVLHGG